MLLIFVFCCGKLSSHIGFASESLVNLKNPGPYLIGFGGSCSGRGGREEEREEGKGGEGRGEIIGIVRSAPGVSIAKPALGTLVL